jgi:hypothetical protein
MIPETIKVDAIHESGHCIFADLLEVPIHSVTLKHPAHVSLSLKGIFILMFDDRKRAIFYMSGMLTQQYFFPGVPITSRNDRTVLMGLPEHRRIIYTDFINHQLEDSTVRTKIENLASRLLTDMSISF